MISFSDLLTITMNPVQVILTLIVGLLVGLYVWFIYKKTFSGVMYSRTYGMALVMMTIVTALMLMLIFGVHLKWFPVLGLGTPLHYVLPVITLAVYPIAQISRLVKTSYAEAMQQDYVVMARAKGISGGRILLLHVLKNAMIPVITTAGPMIAFLLTGSFVVETIFTIPGIGREFVTAVSNRDYTVVMGLTIFIGALIILCNLVADLLCALVDPRIKLTD